MTKQWTCKAFASLLRANGYVFVRQKGNHQIWRNEGKTLVLPAVKLNAMLARRLIKEHSLVCTA